MKKPNKHWLLNFIAIIADDLQSVSSWIVNNLRQNDNLKANSRYHSVVNLWSLQHYKQYRGIILCKVRPTMMEVNV